MPTPDASEVVSPAALTVRLVVVAGAELTCAREHLHKAMNPTAEGTFSDVQRFEAFVDGEILRAYQHATRAAEALSHLVSPALLEQLEAADDEPK